MLAAPAGLGGEWVGSQHIGSVGGSAALAVVSQSFLQHEGTNPLWNARTGVKKLAIMHWCKTKIGVATSKHAKRKR